MIVLLIKMFFAVVFAQSSLAETAERPPAVREQTEKIDRPDRTAEGSDKSPDKLSAFNEQWARLSAESQVASPACKEFRLALKELADTTKPSSQPQIQAPQAPLIVREALALKKWPGFPLALTQAIQGVLRTKNPPVDLDESKFIADYSKFDTCDFERSVELAENIRARLRTDAVSESDRRMVVETLDQYLQLLTNKQGSRSRAAVALILCDFLAQRDLVAKLAKKDNMIRKVREQYAPKDGKGRRIFDIRQALQEANRPPKTALGLWSEFHEAERLRMEIARIVFFP